jgi:hypothetical protein
MKFALINGRVEQVTLGEAVEVVGVWQRRHPGHNVVDAAGNMHQISDELIYDTKERAEKELTHLNRMWGHFC